MLSDIEAFYPIVGGTVEFATLNASYLHVKHIVHRTVNVAHGVIVVLFTCKFGCDFERLLMYVWDNHHAVARKDGREIGNERFEFHFIFEWLAVNEGIHVRH